MKCPYCQTVQSKVTDSRDADNGIRRRRECLSCGRRFTTHEQVRLPALQVDKRDGRRQEFSRTKLISGIDMACTKRPIPRRDIERLADDIETELQRLGSGVVQSRDLGLMVLERLRTLDEVAYMRYASVYYDFQGAGRLRRTGPRPAAGAPGTAAERGRGHHSEAPGSPRQPAQWAVGEPRTGPRIDEDVICGSHQGVSTNGLKGAPG